MATKLETYTMMADRATERLTAEILDWTSFLQTAGRVYKYPFLSQVLIYTQRPNATACAPYELWTTRMNRYVRRGSTGIALIDSSGGKPILRYVFDVADTGPRQGGIDPYLWRITPQNQEAVTTHLASCYGISADKGLADQLIRIAVLLADARWDDCRGGIQYNISGSLLDGLDDNNIERQFRGAVTVSIAYTLLARCGIDTGPYFTLDDFSAIGDFNTRDTVMLLGVAVTSSCEQVLRQIERANLMYNTREPQRKPAPAPQTESEPKEKPAPVPPEQEEQGRSAFPDNDEHEQVQLDMLPSAPPEGATKDSTAVDVTKAAPTSAPRSRTDPPAILHHKAELYNYNITADNIGAGTPGERSARNMAAIRLLHQIEYEQRLATPDEQHTLAQYVGWGGLADYFDPQSSHYDLLKSHMSESEYESARASTLNAHYTTPVVIRAIYAALGSMGFKGGNILEPSCGVGNFFGCLPDEMRDSRLYGVELDSITGRIAQQLYQCAQITVAGYEATSYPNDFFDVAIGNVPFGQYAVNDPVYNKLGFSIHNYFFAKALDQIRPGGILAFITSRYTMDSKETSVRKYLAERADLLGAIRLPNNAFKFNAGTEVVTDILFFQKREAPNPVAPDWVSVVENPDGYPVNSYFMDNPHMVLGTPSSESTRYGHDYTVYPQQNMKLADMLAIAIENIHGVYTPVTANELDDEPTDSIPADPSVKNYSYTLIDGEPYFRENSVMSRPKLTTTAKARVVNLIALRDCLSGLIQAQLDNCNDETLAAHQHSLDTCYDRFVQKYGLINSRANHLVFDRDSSYYLLCSLEVLDDDNKFQRKADIFAKRTIKQHTPVTHVDTPQEALAVAIGEKARVDLPFMAKLCGKSAASMIAELSGVIFRIPGSDDYVTADEYLSGNVRRKLKEAQQAAEQDPAYQVNIDALTAAQPRDLEASEIEVRLGATWIAPEYVQQFAYETLNTPMYLRDSIRVLYSHHTAEWRITEKHSVRADDVAAYTTYGIVRKNAYEILEDTLNLRDVRIYDTVKDEHGNERRVINAKQTTLAAQKQQAIKDAFKDWLWRDPDRRQKLVRLYNDTMNCIRPREYDGSHIVFHGINPAISLQPHQLGAIAHALYGGNTLFAHEVGAGKTFEMIATAMEAKYLGLCHKSIFVVPNHLTQQTAAEFLRLYPAANILVTTKRDFETSRRKKFCARIATGDYDAVIIGHSQFEKIPISTERQKRLLDEQINDIEEGIREAKAAHCEHFTVKQMERMKKSLCAQLEKLMAAHRKDDVVTFEQLGVDMMFVDESDSYKNLFLFTKMQNVAGLSTSSAQKSSDMFAKCRYLDEITGGRGIVFATGTPVSNSMTELYTVQRYLQYDLLQSMGMGQFDSWASRFGETVTALELAPEGTGYRARTRFARFFNLPELMAMFKEVADIKTADQLNLPTPEVEYHTVVCKPTEHQKLMVKELSNRAEKVHSGVVDAHVDNMLRITGDGRKLGLDQRIINPNLPDEGSTKINKCVTNVLQQWRDGEADKLTQLIFCDRVAMRCYK